MKSLRYCFTVVMLACFYTEIIGQTEGLAPEIVKSIEKRIDVGYNPSIAIALIDDTATSFFSFGKTHHRGSLVDEHTVYEIGSITKTFTAILLANQALEGDLSISEDINNFLPDSVRIAVKGQNHISLANLSDHTSGLPRLPGNMTMSNPYNPYASFSVDQLYSFISTYEPVRKVGAEYEYSNLAVGLLGHVLALNKQMSYESLVKQTILLPLDMNGTSITLSDDMKKNLAKGHSGSLQVPYWDLPTLAGAGALRSSTSDMALYISANLGITPSDLYVAMDITHAKRHQKTGTGVGLGWHISDGSDGKVIWHNGGTGGFRSFAGFVKETGRGVVVLTNSIEPVDDIGFRLLDPSYPLRSILTQEDAVEVNEKVLKSYVGLYELMPTLKIKITHEGSKLFAQATGQMRFQVFAENDSSFFPTIIPAKLIFHTESDSTVKSLTFVQAGQVLKGVKIE